MRLREILLQVVNLLTLFSLCEAASEMEALIQEILGPENWWWDRIQSLVGKMKDASCIVGLDDFRWEVLTVIYDL